MLFAKFSGFAEYEKNYSPQSQWAVDNVYDPAWQAVKKRAACGEVNVVPQKWQKMLDYDATTNVYGDLKKIIPTYSLTATWFIQGELKLAAHEAQKELQARFNFLKNNVFWQPLDSIHYAVFVVDRYEADKTHTPEEVAHRLDVARKFLYEEMQQLPAPIMSARGISMNVESSISLKGVVNQDAIKLVQDIVRARMNQQHGQDVFFNRDAQGEIIGPQNPAFHMTIGRIARELSPMQYKDLVDYLDRYWVDLPLGSAKVEYLTLAEETGSFNAQHNEATQRILRFGR